MTVSRAESLVRQSGDSDQEHRQSRSELFEELLVERYSCRAFLPQPVSRKTIAKILSMAQRTASWCNSQPWQVTITTGAATDRFRKAFHSHVIEKKVSAETLIWSFRANIREYIWTVNANADSSSTRALASNAAIAKRREFRRLKTLPFSTLPTSPLSPPKTIWERTAPSIAVPMSTILRWPPEAWE
jgi:nitroreductase